MLLDEDIVQRHARHAGHAQVAENEIVAAGRVLCGRNLLEGGRAIARFVHAPARAFENAAQDSANRWFVVHDERARRGGYRRAHCHRHAWRMRWCDLAERYDIRWRLRRRW